MSNTDAAKPLLFDVDEAAARLDSSRRSVYRLVAAGLIAHRRPRGVRGIRFTEADLEAYVADSAVAVAPAPARRRRAA